MDNWRTFKLCSRAKYGCDQFIIDCLMRLGIASDDYTGQEKTVFKTVDWAVSNNVHVHLVAHARKSNSDTGIQGTEDVKNASEISANAFNIITVWRNHKLEKKLNSAKDEAEKAELLEKPPVIMNVAKQRNGDFEGAIGLWFDQKSYHYFSSYDNQTWQREYLVRGDEYQSTYHLEAAQ